MTEFTPGVALPGGELTSGDLAAETSARTAADAAHTADTTDVHGIADTATLVRSIVEGDNVTVDATDPANPIVSATGGDGGGVPSGAGSPEGAVTAAVGALYQDSANGALYEKVNGSGNTGWVAVGGNADQTVPGFTTQTNGHLNALAKTAAGAVVYIGDTAANATTGNGAYWNAPADGEQTWDVFTGVSGEFHFQNAVDGTCKNTGDFEALTVGAGFILKSPNGTRYRLLVANDGTLSTEVAT